MTLANDHEGRLNNLHFFLMAKRIDDRGQECFPLFDNCDNLARPIPLEEVDGHIENHYQSILKQIAELFKSTSQVTDLQKNRGRLSSLINDIRKNIGVSKNGTNAEDIRTFGDVRRTKKKITKTISEAIKGNEKHKDRRLHTHVAYLVEKAFEEVVGTYSTEIKRNNAPRTTADATREDERAPVIEKTIVTATDDERRQESGQETPDWIKELSSDDTAAMIQLFSSPIADVHREAALYHYFNGTTSRFSSNLTERMKLIRKIMRTFGNETSYFHLWLKRNTCVAFFGLTLNTPKDTVQPRRVDIVDSSVFSHPVSETSVPKAQRTAPAANLTQAKITIADMDAKKDDPEAMLALIESVDDVAWQGEHIVKALFNDEHSYQAWRSIVMNRANYAFAVQAIKNLRHGAKIMQDKSSGNPQESWRLVFGHIRRSVSDEIARGDTPFGPDEIEVAFELHLKELKLWAQFCELRTSSNGKPTVSAADEKHPSTMGFNADEIRELSKEDREEINRLFGKVSPDAKKAQHYKDINEGDASIFSEIARILLMHQETIAEQFKTRLGLRASLVWKAIEYRKMHVLSKEEKSAIRRIEQIISTMDILKESDPEAFEDRVFEMRKYMALYRRLLRLEHADDESERLNAAMAILGTKVTDVKRWERKDFAGLSNDELAPELFPSAESKPEHDDHSVSSRHDHAHSDAKSAPVQKNQQMHSKATVPTAPAPAKAPASSGTYRTIFEALKHESQETFEPATVSPENFEPTDAPPGSPEKMEVIAQRLRAGLPISHPRDRCAYDPDERK